MARTSAKAKKQRQEATRNRDKGEESADSLPSDNQENIENGAQKDKSSRKTITKIEQEEEQEDNDFEVEKIVEVHHKKNGKREFLIRWKGFTSKDDTWEPEENLDCPEMIEKFMAKVDKNDISDSEKKGKKRGKIENSKRKEKKVKREKSTSEDDDEDETSKNDFDNDVSDSEKKGKKRGKVENSKTKEKKVKRERKSDAEDSDEETSTANYDVEKIVEVHHKKNGKREFLIRWKGFTSKDDTWEPEENLDCPAMIEKFMAKVDKAKRMTVRELRDQRPRTQRFTPTVPGVRTSHRNQGKARTVFYTE